MALKLSICLELPNNLKWSSCIPKPNRAYKDVIYGMVN